MPALLICPSYRQSPLQPVPSFHHLALSDQRLRLAFIHHERKACIGIIAAYLYGSLEKRKRFSISLRLIEAVTEHFQHSNLAAHIATRHRRKESIADHRGRVTTVAFKKGDDPEFPFCSRFPLCLSERVGNVSSFRPGSLRGSWIDLQVRVSLCGKAPKPEFLVTLHNRKPQLLPKPL